MTTTDSSGAAAPPPPADPYGYTPFRQHLAHVLHDYHAGGLDGLDDAVEAIMNHPEFARVWRAYLDSMPPEHGEQREIGHRPMWWDRNAGLWRWSPDQLGAE